MNFKQAHSSNFKVGRTQPILYIVEHYTANNGDTAKNNADYFNRAVVKASAHYFVDENGVWQSVKDSDTAYHCGTTGTYKHPKCRNDNSIGIEMCSRKDANGNYYFSEATIKNAANLTKELMLKYNIPKENVVRHYDVTGKICPAPMVKNEVLWKEFKAMLTSKQKLESGNDIIWELMNGKHKVKISEVKRAVTALDKAKNNHDYSSLYWILYKLVNGND